jgi:hypothetical protein
MLVELPDDLVDAVLALAGRLREAREALKMYGDLPHELCETDMAPHLGMTDGALRKRRERGEFEGLYRKQSRSIMYFTAMTLAAWERRSPDKP